MESKRRADLLTELLEEKCSAEIDGFRYWIKAKKTHGEGDVQIIEMELLPQDGDGKNIIIRIRPRHLIW